jgi:hypothetical protein
MIDIRRIFTQVEDIFHEFGPPATAAAAARCHRAVLTNPYAGRYEPDILPMMEALNPLGLAMAQQLLAAMAVPAERIEGYGKGAIIGAPVSWSTAPCGTCPAAMPCASCWAGRATRRLRQGCRPPG